MADDILTRLQATIAARRTAAADKSYTRQLLDAGPKKCAKKLGEEGVEAALAAVSGDRTDLRNEAADVLYHLLIVLRAADLPLAEVFAELESRTARTGLEEKASRPPE